MDEAQGEQPPSAQTKSAKKEEDPQLRV
jgi:tellurite resistance protein TerC